MLENIRSRPMDPFGKLTPIQLYIFLSLERFMFFLWFHTQMLHGMGIFTQPFPLECGHFSAFM